MVICLIWVGELNLMLWWIWVMVYCLGVLLGNFMFLFGIDDV